VIEVVDNRLIAAPALSVWQLLEDFGSIQRWWPADGRIRIAKVEIEGDGVGMIRHIYNHGAKHAISERLDLLDSESRTLVLSIIGTRPPGITAYVAEARVVDVAGHQCRMDYRALITTSGVDDEKVRSGVLKTWSVMFAGLERTAQANG
jgi:uncharacterized protein YndB with AHSA1/START domain